MEPDKLYKLMTWLSPAFPVGAYAYSHGLEYAVEAGIVTNRTELEHWLESILRHGTGRVDSIIFKEVYQSSDNDLSSLVELASAMRGTSELAQESHMQGQAFVRTIEAAWSGSQAASILGESYPQELPIPYVVSVALTCKSHDIPIKEALMAYLQSFTSNLVSAGIRLIPLGHSDGQIAIDNLEGVINDVVDNALKNPISDIGSSTPMLDWMSMQHESQNVRLFRS